MKLQTLRRSCRQFAVPQEFRVRDAGRDQSRGFTATVLAPLVADLLTNALVTEKICGISSNGIDYSVGTKHLVEGSHTVPATNEEFRSWLK